MLRITVQSDPATAKRYFSQGTHDYLAEGGKAPPGAWGGVGAERLGLSGEIAQADWDRLCDNLHPQTGEQLTVARRGNRRVFYDCTWSLPKSASVASLFDPRIVDSFREAVDYANGLIEHDLAVRVRVGGADADRVVGNAVVGSYLHTTARPVNGVSDPHVHVHSCFFNAAFDPVEGRWKAAQLGPVKTHAGFYEQAMLSRLAEGLRTLGYGVRRKGRYFELEHVPEGIVDKFSARRDVIDRTAMELGMTDPDRKAELGATTRERKNTTLSADELRDHWLSRLTAGEKALLAARPGQRARLPTVGEAVAHALAHVFEAEAVAAQKRVCEHALMYGVGNVTLEDVRAALPAAGLLTRGELATTREVLGLERAVIDAARLGRGTCRPIAPHHRPTAAVPLTRGQREAVAHALSTPDRWAVIRGAAGTGKTTALAEIARATRDAGLPVMAAAVTHAATDELAKEVDPTAVTVAALLTDPRAAERVRGGLLILDEASQLGLRDTHRLAGVLARADARLLLVGDHRQHGPVAAGSPYTLLLHRAGLPAAEITENRRQKPPRYREAVDRLAQGRVGEGFALLEQMGWVRERAVPDQVRAVAADYVEAVVAGRSVLVVAPTNAECELVNGHVRQMLRAAGRLSGEERAFPRLVPMHLSEAERADRHAVPAGTVARFARDKGGYRRHQEVDAAAVAGDRKLAGAWAAYRPAVLTLAVGDRVRTTAGTADAAGKRLANHTRMEVTGFTPDGVRVKTATGLARTLLPQAVAVLAHDYAATSFASQGRTVDRVVVSEPAASLGAAGRQQVYVAVSRARHECFVYTDDLAALRTAAERDRAKRNASDLVDLLPVPVRAPRSRAWAQFFTRVGQLAAAVGERVRELGGHKGVGYGYG